MPHPQQRTVDEASAAMNEKLKKTINFYLKDKSNDIYELTSTNKTTLGKFLTTQDYIIDDIEKTLDVICKDDKQTTKYCVIRELAAIQNQLEGFKNQEQPYYIFYSNPSNIWTLSTLMKNDGNIYLLFKDPTGQAIEQKFLDVIENKIGKLGSDYIKNNTINNIGELAGDDAKYIPALSGPLALRNMIAIKHQVKDKAFRDGYGSSQIFQSPKQLNLLKINTALALADSIKGGHNDFINQCKKLFKLVGEISTFKNEHTGDEQKKCPSPADLKKEFGINDPEKVKKEWEKKIEEVKKKDKEELELAEKYSEELNDLSMNLFIFQCCFHDENLKTAMNTMKEIYGIAAETIEQFLASKKSKSNEPDKPTPGLKDCTEFKPHDPISADPKEKSPEQVIAEIDFKRTGKSRTTTPSSEYRAKLDSDTNAAQLEKYFLEYERLKSYLLASSVDNIFNWGKKTKADKLKRDYGSICLALAYANRALELKKGYNLRHPQVCSCLIMLLMGKEGNGKCLQINTGEGKTQIIGVVSSILALMGHKVDIITSNNVLANEGLNDTRDWTCMLGVTAGCNVREKESDVKEGCSKPLDYCTKSYNKVNKYTHDIVYGCISNFQFDYLKDKVEDLKERKERKFDYVILDEVDNMLIDNGGHVAKLAEPFPGMESLRAAYIHIWKTLNKIVHENIEEVRVNAEKYFKSLVAKHPNDMELVNKLFQECLVGDKNPDEECTPLKSEQAILDEVQKLFTVEVIKLVPSHIKRYVWAKRRTLINNAYFAKYGCEQNRNYIIKFDSKSQTQEADCINTPESTKKPKYRKIIPVDNENTGITLRDTIWSYGLHQFVQLKHNLHLTFESLTSSFISNIGYVGLYDHGDEGVKIIGVTGTLGKEKDQNLISKICKGRMDFFEIPPYKTSLLKELSGTYMF